MSSNTYFAELKTNAGLRGLVLLSGFFLGVIGLLLIMTLRLHPAVCAGASACWIFLSVRELLVLARGFGATSHLRFGADGSLMRLDQDGSWHKSRLLPGSVVLPALAWIRLETAPGHHSAELLRGRCRESHNWRRLQVIWRHIGAAE